MNRSILDHRQVERTLRPRVIDQDEDISMREPLTLTKTKEIWFDTDD